MKILVPFVVGILMGVIIGMYIATLLDINEANKRITNGANTVKEARLRK